MNREIELKFDTDAGLADALLRSELLAGVCSNEAEQEAVYFDGPAGELVELGFSLRVRRTGGGFIQTIKQDGTSSAGLFDRSEWEAEVRDFELDLEAVDGTPLGDLLTKKLRRRLAPIIRTRVRRRSWKLVREDGLIELTMDDGEIISGSKSAPVHELEMEMKSGDPASLFLLAEQLAENVPLRLGVLSKSERGYRLAADRLDRYSKAEPLLLEPGISVADGFAAVVTSCLRHFRLNEPIVVARRDPDALHQARVAMRRLRSSLNLFRRAVAGDEFERIREELRWFTAHLGDARNLDVFMKRLPSGRKLASIDGGKAVAERLSQAREAAYGRVIEVLGSQRCRRLLLDLFKWAEIGEWRSRPKSSAPLLAFGARQLNRRWSKVREGGARIAAVDAETRHQLRIDVKKMRYSAEFLAGLHRDKKADLQRAEFLAGLADLQDHLGDLNDAETARELLSTLHLESEDERRFAATLVGREPDMEECLKAAQEAFERSAAASRYWR